MTHNDDPEGHQDALYRIGAVANLTGLPANTIRTWERRYSVVDPERSSGGGRLYNEADVLKLQLIQALTEAGESISSVARLSTDQLRERLAAHTAAEQGGAMVGEVPEIASIAVVHETLAEQLRLSGAVSKKVSLVRSATNVDAFYQEGQGQPAQILIASLSALGTSPTVALRRCMEISGATSAIVTFQFARKDILSAMVSSGARLLQGPVHIPSLLQGIEDQLVIRGALQAVHRSRAQAQQEGRILPDVEGVAYPPRAVSDDQLMRLRTLESRIKCECPNHIAAIVSSMVEFEAYARGCGDQKVGDARLHAYLGHQTATARLAMEELLLHLIETDGLEV